MSMNKLKKPKTCQFGTATGLIIILNISAYISDSVIPCSAVWLLSVIMSRKSLDQSSLYIVIALALNFIVSEQVGNDAGNVVNCWANIRSNYVGKVHDDNSHRQGRFIAALRILRVVVSAKLLMLTRCVLTQSNIVRLSNIAARTQRRVTGISVITRTMHTKYTNLFFTNDIADS